MNNRTRFIIRYIFVVLLGVFLHYAYDLSGGNPIVGLFALVSESVWEHLKLVFYPMMALTLWDLISNRRNYATILPARTVGVLSGMAFTIVAFYTVTGIIGAPIAWVNILLYLIAIVVTFRTESLACRRRCLFRVTTAIIILVGLLVLFIVFTIAPPAIGLFTPMME